MQMQKMMEDLGVMVTGEGVASQEVPETHYQAAKPAKKISRLAPVPAARRTKAAAAADFLPLDEDEEEGRGKIGKVSGF